MGIRGVGGSVAGAIGSVPISGFTGITNIFQKDVTFTAGAIDALLGTEVTTTVTGLLTTDQVLVQCISAPTAGMVISSARVSATNTLAVFFVTSVALGITLGSLTFRVTVFR